MEGGTTIRKGIELGSGGFAHVFRAVQSNTQRVVALKQSRASLQLKRPLLQHEARVLKLLSGHPNIPEVYAYGRIEHFELISMQLLHRSLGDMVKEDGPLRLKMVANMACQMIDVLQHIHSYSLVHRDIKPDNIMLKSPNSWDLCLIDFGLTRPLPSLLTSTTPTMREGSNSASEEPGHVFGTLPFASLNAHEKDAQLTFRDDFESLSYTLLWLLRGSLPWSHFAQSGTPVGRIRQVFAQKQRHNGSSLAAELPVDFGELVEYARSLSFDEKPDYHAWRRLFKQVQSAAKGGALTPERQPSQSFLGHPECPVEVGQVVLIKLDSSVAADGYTIREGHESSFIPDPLFSTPDWSTPYRPAVVTQVGWDERARKHTFLAIAISRRSNRDEDTTARAIPITADGSHTNGTYPSIRMEPGWPFDDAYFYVFKRPVEFYCLPSQEPVHSTWRVTRSGCDNLLKDLSPPPDSLSDSHHQEDLESPDPDIRHDARTRDWGGPCKLYAHVRPLTSAHLDDDSIDWHFKRAWFDECVKVTRYHNLNYGIWWTGAWFPSPDCLHEWNLRDSYYESDHSMWEVQSERRKSITLGAGDEILESTGVPAGLATIVGLEQESED
ncbi:unnamed protein product [Rhizoctonia solani]|uniref:non-specific serine/threonine protein kinase n=1 Tax=Rhizoctonia solani TaxID=456999 RepID=A0A8H2XLY0_9AGAM|nr:unnamed protein product [Rhizoctonia solani]